MPALPLPDPRVLPEDSRALSRLAPGECAVVIAVDAEPRLADRLGDLGFVPGTPVRVVRRSPLGDPTEYEIRGYRICLRRSEGERIRVRRA